MPQGTIREQRIQLKGKKLWGSQQILPLRGVVNLVPDHSNEVSVTKKRIVPFPSFPVHIKIIFEIAVIILVHRQASYISSHPTSRSPKEKANITRPKVRNTVTQWGLQYPHFHQTENQHGNAGLSYTLEQLSLIDITWPIFPSAAKYTFFSELTNTHQIRAHVRTQPGLFLKTFIESVIILLLPFYVFVFLARGLWDHNSSTRGQTTSPALEGDQWS